MIEFVCVVVLVWMFIMTCLLVPDGTVKSLFDRLLRGKLRRDKVVLQIMLDNLRSFPEQWNVSNGHASFPATGTKKIILSLDDKRNIWTYNLDSFGSEFRPLRGHYGAQFDSLIAQETSARESRAVLKQFYPELNGTLMLK